MPYKDPSKRAAQKRRWRTAKKEAGIIVPSGTRVAWSARDTEKINHNRRTKNAAKFSQLEFLAWDGEGVGHPRNRYIMLSNSKRQVIEGNDLSKDPKRVFDFLLQQGSDKKTVNVIYGGGYDFTHWIMYLPDSAKRTLYKDGKVIWEDYYIEYVPRKKFTVVYWKGGKSKKRAVTVWDVIGFFQCPFVLAIETWLKGEVSTEQLAMIKKMKAERGVFTADNKAGILEYNFQECELLARLMTKLRDLFQVDPDNPGNIEPWLGVTRWDGAGALASAMYRKVGIKPHIGSAAQHTSIKGDKKLADAWHYESVEQQLEVETALRSAFFGGRIECFKKGRANQPAWSVDLKSAYPWGMITLPSFAKGGEWKKVRKFNPRLFGVWNIEWECGGDIYQQIPMKGHTIFPYPYRTLFGGVHFPQAGKGWVHTCEAIAGMNDKRNTVKVLGGWVWQPITSEKPFTFVVDFFEQRIRLQAVGHPAEKVLKLGLNSLYGKTAQTLGSEFVPIDEVDKIFAKVPPYFNLAWAGAITAACRGVMYTEAIKRESDIVMIQTDGLFGIGKPPIYQETKKLGSFELTCYHDLMVVQAGVYYMDTKGEGFAAGKSKTRGFHRNDINPEMILKAWAKEQHEIHYTSAPRFVTMGACITKQNDTFEHLGEWVSQDRKLDLYKDSKREVETTRYVKRIDDVVPTHPRLDLRMYDARERGTTYHLCPDPSRPYDPKWREENAEDVWRRNTEPMEEGSDFIVNAMDEKLDVQTIAEIEGASDVFAELRNL